MVSRHPFFLPFLYYHSACQNSIGGLDFFRSSCYSCDFFFFSEERCSSWQALPLVASFLPPPSPRKPQNFRPLLPSYVQVVPDPYRVRTIKTHLTLFLVSFPKQKGTEAALFPPPSPFFPGEILQKNFEVPIALGGMLFFLQTSRKQGTFPTLFFSFFFLFSGSLPWPTDHSGQRVPDPLPILGRQIVFYGRRDGGPLPLFFFSGSMLGQTLSDAFSSFPQLVIESTPPSLPPLFPPLPARLINRMGPIPDQDRTFSPPLPAVVGGWHLSLYMLSSSLSKNGIIFPLR